MNQRDAAAYLGEIQRVLQGGVSPADQYDILPFKEGAVTGRAVRNTPAGKFFLARTAEMAPFRPVGEDDGPALILSAGG